MPRCSIATILGRPQSRLSGPWRPWASSRSGMNGRQMWDELERWRPTPNSMGGRPLDLISLVLTDIEMPEMDGYILTKRIKSDRALPAFRSSCIRPFPACQTRSSASRSGG